ncbi:MAG: Raf kinase inhibitor-like YbhB/YbcL family protein [Myxococcota bacterium]|jgi:Raf kinase inhibitor-like YbhB/YbcL family protein
MSNLIPATLAILTMLAAGCASGPSLPLQGPIPNQGHPALDVTSADFANDGPLGQASAFDQFGCTGTNTRPHLAWSTVPPGTKSVAIIVHDPDAPTGVGFFHWVAINIPPTVTSLKDALPDGVSELHTDYGGPGYGGPCPPSGRNHRYVFSVFALDTVLELPAGATGALTRFVIANHTLATGRLVGTYQRPSAQ